MPVITNKSFISYEVTEVRDTGKRVSIFTSVDYGVPRFITRKVYENPNGRIFVAYNGGFHEVLKSNGEYVLMLGGGHFTKGAWHFDEEEGWVEGRAPEDTTKDDAKEPVEDAVQEVATETEASVASDDDTDFNLYDMFFGEG